MKVSHSIFIIAGILLVTSCNDAAEKPAFQEVILDEQAPEHLWMKTTGDINDDDKIDILVGGRQKGGLVAYLAPDWKKQTINDSIQVGTDGEVSDIDKNNAADVVLIVNQAIVWLEGPDWKLHFIDSIVAHDVEVHDFDNDGLMDIAMRNQGAFGNQGGHTLYFYKQKPDMTWSRYQKEIPDGEGLKMADINKDEKMDIVTNAHWYENTGDMEEWKEHRFSNTWTWPNTHIDVADMNNDGRPDILHSPAELHGNHYRISWFEAPKDPASTWKEHTVADSIETVVHSIGTADFDSDGETDIIIAEMQQGADPDEVAVFYKRESTWEKQTISNGGSHSMRLLDVDDDGDVDVVGANFAERILKMWTNERKK